MPRAPKKRAGVDAIINCKVRFVGPTTPIRAHAKYQNTYNKADLLGGRIYERLMRRIKPRGRILLAYRFRHDDFGDTDLFVAVANCTVVQEGPPISFFDQPAEADEEPNEPPSAEAELRASSRNAVQLPFGSDQGVLARGATRDDISALRAQNISVDDDNDPAPENVPDSAPGGSAGGRSRSANSAAAPARPKIGDVWNWCAPNVCPRRAQGVTDAGARFSNHSWDTISNMTPLQVFFLCYPQKYLTEVVIPATNSNLTLGPTNLSEIISFFGCIFFMSCFQGVEERRDWWSKTPPSMESGAPFRLNEYMSRDRFEDIIQGLRYTTAEPPAYRDKFYEVREMWEYWNAHYHQEYVPSYLSCLDESVSEWLNQYGPGWMFIPRKPHPYGNEYHTIADAETTIIYRMECVEGKDRPPELGPQEHDDKGKTVGVMMRLTKSIHNTGKIVEQDSGFCVFEGIVAQHDVGVYGDALIKKRRYWPKHVPGDEIDAAMADAPVGTVKTLKGKVNGRDAFIHCLKEEEYVTKIMSMFGTQKHVLAHQTRRSYKNPTTGQQSVLEFTYTEPFSRYYKARHSVDDNNNRRHQPISVETSWGTKWWPSRQQAFHLAVAAVNANLALARAKGLDVAQPELLFRKALAIEMLQNTIGLPDVPRQIPVRQVNVVQVGHRHVAKPYYSGAYNVKTGKFSRIKKKYGETTCATCNNRCRHYCICSIEKNMCRDCYLKHYRSL